MHDQAAELLKLWARIAENGQRLTTLDADRSKTYTAQQQVQALAKPTYCFLHFALQGGILRVSATHRLKAKAG